MGDISQGVQSLNLMSLFKSPLGPFFGDLELCYGKNWNSFWKYLSGEVCTYLSLDHPCTGGLFQGPYILLSLKYFLWFTAISRAFLWHQKPITGIVWEHVYIVHVLARVYMHVLVQNRKICVQDSSITDIVCQSVCLSEPTNNQSLGNIKEWPQTLVDISRH